MGKYFNIYKDASSYFWDIPDRRGGGRDVVLKGDAEVNYSVKRKLCRSHNRQSKKKKKERIMSTIVLRKDAEGIIFNPVKGLYVSHETRIRVKEDFRIVLHMGILFVEDIFLNLAKKYNLSPDQIKAICQKELLMAEYSELKAQGFTCEEVERILSKSYALSEHTVHAMKYNRAIYKD